MLLNLIKNQQPDINKTYLYVKLSILDQGKLMLLNLIKNQRPDINKTYLSVKLSIRIKLSIAY